MVWLQYIVNHLMVITLHTYTLLNNLYNNCITNHLTVQCGNDPLDDDEV